MNQIGEKWEEIKQHIKTEYDLSPVSFNTWIQPLKFHDVDHDTVQIVIPSDQAHAVSYISAKYKNYFQVSISEMFNHEYNVSFLLEKDIHNKKENEEEDIISSQQEVIERIDSISSQSIPTTLNLYLFSLQTYRTNLTALSTSSE